MTSETILIIVASVVFIAGLIVGLLINKYRLGSSLAVSESATAQLRDQLAKTSAQLDASAASLEHSKEQHQLVIQQLGRVETRLEQQAITESELRKNLQSELIEKHGLNGELVQLKESFVALKTKNDEISRTNLEINNEKSRAKGQLEEFRLREQDLTRQIADLSARNEELKKKSERDLIEIQQLQRDIRTLQLANTALTGQNHSLAAKHDAALKAVEEQREFVTTAKKELKDSFDSLSASALDKNNQSFLDLAKTQLTTHIGQAKSDLDLRQQAIDSLVKPLGESLSKMDEKINSLESKREGAYQNIGTLLDQMKQSTVALDRETRNLVTALKSSHTRGRYGEIALRRLVEFAGMTDQCDFQEQVSTEADSGKLRPDMVIKLPGNRSVVVDSKVPLSSYLQIFETEDVDAQKRHLQNHANAIRIHLRQLSAKAYWDQFDNAPDFVVMFMQIESSFGAALQEWPGLLEEALNNRIIVATPTTLITILRSIGYSWNQLKTMENIEEIRTAAVSLYERSATLMEHLVGIGKNLSHTVNNYNKAVGSLESYFLPQGRRIYQLSQAYIKKQLTEITPVELSVRPVIALPPTTEDDENSDNGTPDAAI